MSEHADTSPFSSTEEDPRHNKTPIDLYDACRFAERDGERTLKPVGGPDDSGESIEAQTILSQGATPSQKPLESPPATAEKAAEVKEDDKA